ncbi:MAG: hypothetical protein H0W64_04445 [Gammaproteobacteria bacterium]|nr:hypothetical protein [Gammaproteobacteria bacterium]
MVIIMGIQSILHWRGKVSLYFQFLLVVIVTSVLIEKLPLLKSTTEKQTSHTVVTQTQRLQD